MEFNFVSRDRKRLGLKHIEVVPRHFATKKPIGDLSKGDLYLRDFSFMSLLRRVQSLEDKFSHDTPIREVLEVHYTGEVFRSYFEIHMIPKFDWSRTRDGRVKTAF